MKNNNFLKITSLGIACILSACGILGCGSVGDNPTQSLGMKLVEANDDAKMNSKEAIVERIIASLDKGSLNVTVGSTDQDLVFEAIEEVYDRPEYFWLGFNCNIVSINGINTLTFEKKYSGDIDKMKLEVEEAAGKIISSIPEDADTFDKIKYVHDYLCDSITYTDKNDDTDNDLYAALVVKECVCEGYADAFNYLMNGLGIESYFCSGDAQSSEGKAPHAWNRVVLDGESYYFDVTWDDDDFNGQTLYTYFGVDSSTIMSNHFFDENHPVVYTSATDYNYYYHNGYVIEEYSDDAFAEVMSKQGDVIDVKCTNDISYWHLTQNISSGNYIVKIMDKAGKSWDYNTQFSSFRDEDARTIRLFIK